MDRFVASIYGLFIVAGLTGCPSVSTLTTARPIEVGKTSFCIAPSVGSVSLDEDLGASLIPSVELAGRYGVSENLDIGLKFGPSGLSTDFKIALHRSDSIDRGIDLSINPTLQYNWLPVTVSLPLLIGVNMTGGYQLVLGPRGMAQWFGSYGTSEETTSLTLLYTGGSAGIYMPLSESFALMPEATVLYPIGMWGENLADLRSDLKVVLFQVGIGFLFN